MATEIKSSCACGARGGDGDHGSSVDPEIKHSISTRLRRIEGQVRGLQKMIEEERYCADVLVQLSSVQEALRGVGRGGGGGGGGVSWGGFFPLFFSFFPPLPPPSPLPPPFPFFPGRPAPAS